MSDAIESFRDLRAWKLAMKLGLDIYEVTKSFPDDERFGLTSQMRRGAVAVPSNIAEGYGRQSRIDYLRILKIARGALFELETQLWFALSLGYISKERFDAVRKSHEDAAMVLAGLIRGVSE
jgi:four helix bundle protein